MYKTAVYTLVNGGIQGLTHQKQQKSQKGDITVHIYALYICYPPGDSSR